MEKTIKLFIVRSITSFGGIPVYLFLNSIDNVIATAVWGVMFGIY